MFIDDLLIIDKFIIYEDKENTINNILSDLGIKSKYIKEKKIKNFISPFNSSNYKKIYNKESIELVESHLFFNKFCKLFNYKF